MRVNLNGKTQTITEDQTIDNREYIEHFKTKQQPTEDGLYEMLASIYTKSGDHNRLRVVHLRGIIDRKYLFAYSGEPSFMERKDNKAVRERADLDFDEVPSRITSEPVTEESDFYSFEIPEKPSSPKKPSFYCLANIEGKKSIMQEGNLEVSEVFHCEREDHYKGYWYRLKPSTYETSITLDNGNKVYLMQNAEGRAWVARLFVDGKGFHAYSLSGAKMVERSIGKELGILSMPDGRRISVRLEKSADSKKGHIELAGNLDLSKRSFELKAEGAPGNMFSLLFNSGKAQIKFMGDGSIITTKDIVDSVGRVVQKGARISLINNNRILSADIWASKEEQGLIVGDYRKLSVIEPGEGAGAKPKRTYYNEKSQVMWGLIHIMGGKVTLSSYQVLHVKNSTLTTVSSNEWIMLKVSEFADGGEIYNFLVYKIETVPINYKISDDFGTKKIGEREIISVKRVYRKSELWTYRGADNKTRHRVTFMIVEDNVHIYSGDLLIPDATVTGVVAFSHIEEISKHWGGTWSWQEFNAHYIVEAKEILAEIPKIAESYGFKEGITYEIEGRRFIASLKALSNCGNMSKSKYIRAFFTGDVSGRQNVYQKVNLKYALDVDRKQLWINGEPTVQIQEHKFADGSTLIYLLNADQYKGAKDYLNEFGYVNCYIIDGRMYQTDAGKYIEGLWDLRDKIASTPDGPKRDKTQNIYRRLEERVQEKAQHSRSGNMLSSSEVNSFNRHYYEVRIAVNGSRLDYSFKQAMQKLNEDIGKIGRIGRVWNFAKRKGIAALEGADDMAQQAEPGLVFLAIYCPPAALAPLASSVVPSAKGLSIGTRLSLYAARAANFGARLTYSFWKGFRTFAAINVSLYVVGSIYHGTPLTIEGLRMSILRAVPWALVFVPLGMIGTGSSVSTAWRASSVKWNILANSKYGVRWYNWLSPFAVKTAQGFRSGWAILGWGTAAYTTCDFVWSVSKGSEASWETFGKSLKHGVIAATLLAVGWTLASGYRNLATFAKAKAGADAGRAVSEAAMEKAPKVWRVSFALKGLSPLGKLVGSTSNKTISGYGLFGVSSTIPGAIYAYNNRDKYSGSSLVWRSVVNGAMWGLVITGGTALLINYLPAVVRSWKAIRAKEAGHLFKKADILGETPGAFGFTGAGRFTAALLHPRTSKIAYNYLWGQAFGIGSHMITFTAIGKGILTPWLAPYLRKKANNARSRSTKATLAFLANGIERFGDQSYVDAAKHGFIFGMTLAPFGSAMEVSGAAFARGLSKFKGLRKLLNGISTKKGFGIVASEAAGIVREAYVEGTVSTILQSVGVPQQIAESLVEFIPGIGGGAVSVNVRPSRVSAEAVLVRTDAVAANKQTGSCKVADVLKTEDEHAAAAKLLESAGINVTPAGLKTMSFAALEKLAQENGRGISSFDFLNRVHKLKTGHVLSVKEFAQVTGQTLHDLANTYNLNIVITNNTPVIDISGFFTVADALHSPSLSEDKKAAIETYLESKNLKTRKTTLSELPSDILHQFSEIGFADFAHGLRKSYLGQYTEESFAKKRGLIYESSVVALPMSIKVFMYEAGKNTPEGALTVIGYTQKDIDGLREERGVLDGLTVGAAAAYLSKVKGPTIADTLASLKEKHGFEILNAWVRPQIDSLTDLAQKEGMSITELLIAVDNKMDTILDMEKQLGIPKGKIVARVNKNLEQGKHVNSNTKLDSLKKKELNAIGAIKLEEINQEKQDKMLKDLATVNVQTYVVELSDSHLVIPDKANPDETTEARALTEKSLTKLQNTIKKYRNNPYIEFVFELADGTPINLDNAKLSLDNRNGVPVLCITHSTLDGFHQDFVDGNGNAVEMNVLARDIEMTVKVEPKFDSQNREYKDIFNENGEFKPGNVTITATDLEDNVITEGHDKDKLFEAIKTALYDTVKEMKEDTDKHNIPVNFGLRDNISVLGAILQVALTKNTFFEIPTGFGKTQTVYRAVAVMNSILKNNEELGENNPFKGRHTIYITHNSPEFMDNALKTNSVNRSFMNRGMGIVAICQNGVLANPEHIGDDGQYAQFTLADIQQNPQYIIDRLKRDDGVDVIYMDADTFMFLQLTLIRNAENNPQVARELWNQIFNNAKVIHDEVDTAFFRNRAQEGLDTRPLTPEEIKYLKAVDKFMYDFIKKHSELADVADGDYAEALRSLLIFKFKRNGNVIERTYAQWVEEEDRAMDYITVYFRKNVHEAFMKFISEKTGIEFGNLDEFYRSDNPKVVAYRVSMVGLTNCIMQYLGGDIELDEDSHLIKPAPYGVLAPQLQLSDPYFAGHTELVFKRVRGEEAYLSDTDDIKGIRLSNLSTVTSMASAMADAINAGADFGGFSGTLSSVQDLGGLLFGIKIDTSMGSEILPFDYESRVISLFKAHNYDMARNQAIGQIIGRDIPYVMFMEGATRHDDNPMSGIRAFVESGRTVLYKCRDKSWLLYTKDRLDNPLKIRLKSSNGTIAVENFMTELARVAANPDYSATAIEKLEDLGLSRQEAETIINQNKLIFYLIAPATRAVDIQLTELKKALDAEGSKVECFGIIDSGTTKDFFEQLAGRDRGIRYIIDENSKYKDDTIKDKDGKEQRQYHPLHVFMVDSNVSKIEQVHENPGAVLKKLLVPIGEKATKRACYNSIAELIDIRLAKFLSSQKDNETEENRKILHEVITMYQSFLTPNSDLRADGLAKDSIQALQERINRAMEFLQNFRDNDGRFKGRGLYKGLSKTTRDAIEAELEVFGNGNMQLHLAPTKEGLDANRRGKVAFGPAMSNLVASINANISTDMLPETPSMAGPTTSVAPRTDKQDVENAAREAGLTVEVFQSECEERGWRDSKTGKYTKEAALAAEYAKKMQKSKVASTISFVLSALFRGHGLDDDKDRFYMVLRLMDEGYLSGAIDNFNTFEARINFVHGLINKGVLSKKALSDETVIKGLRHHASGAALAKALKTYLKFFSREQKALNHYVSMRKASYYQNLYKFRENYKIEPWIGLPMRRFFGVPAPILVSVLLSPALGIAGRLFFMHSYVMIGGGVLPDFSIATSEIANKAKGVYYGIKAGWFATRIIKDVDYLVRTTEDAASAKFMLHLRYPTLGYDKIDSMVDKHTALRKLGIKDRNIRKISLADTEKVDEMLNVIESIIKNPEPDKSFVEAINKGKVTISPEIVEPVKIILQRQRIREIRKQRQEAQRVTTQKHKILGKLAGFDTSLLRVPISSLTWQERIQQVVMWGIPVAFTGFTLGKSIAAKVLGTVITKATGITMHRILKISMFGIMITVSYKVAGFVVNRIPRMRNADLRKKTADSYLELMDVGDVKAVEDIRDKLLKAMSAKGKQVKIAMENAEKAFAETRSKALEQLAKLQKKSEEPPIDIKEIKSKQKKSSDKFTTVEKPDTQSSGREDIQATKSSQITDELFKDRNREVIEAEVEKYKEIKEANRIEAAVKETTAPEDAEKDSKIPKAQKAVARPLSQIETEWKKKGVDMEAVETPDHIELEEFERHKDAAKGLGAKALKDLIDFAKQQGKPVYLSARNRRGLQKYYEKQGFVFDHITGEGNIRMRYDVPAEKAKVKQDEKESKIPIVEVPDSEEKTDETQTPSTGAKIGPERDEAGKRWSVSSAMYRLMKWNFIRSLALKFYRGKVYEDNVINFGHYVRRAYDSGKLKKYHIPVYAEILRAFYRQDEYEDSLMGKMMEKWQHLDFSKDEDIEKFLVETVCRVQARNAAIPLLEVYLSDVDPETDRRIIKWVEARLSFGKKLVKPEDLLIERTGDESEPLGEFSELFIRDALARVESSPASAALFRLIAAKGYSWRLHLLQSLKEDIERVIFEKMYPHINWDEVLIEQLDKALIRIKSLLRVEDNEAAGEYIESKIREMNAFADTVVGRKIKLQELIDNGQAFVKDGITFIKIEGLLENTIQFGHIGLGQTYGKSVAYIDSEYADNKTVIDHELEERRLWEDAIESSPMLEGVNSLAEVREWMRQNPVQAIALTEELHNKANEKYNVDKLAKDRGIVLKKWSAKYLQGIDRTPSVAATPGTVGKGPFRSLLMMFGVSAVMGLVLPAISRAASSPVVEGLKGDIVGAGVSMLQAVGIGLGLIAGGIAINYGVKAVREWVERRAVSTITEGAKGDRKIAFRDAGEIKAGLVKAVEKELIALGGAGLMSPTLAQVNKVKAEEIVEEFLKGVIPVNEIEKEALIKAVTKVEIGTLRGEPVNFSEMVLGEVPGRENIQRALLEERGRTLEELLRELLRTDYMREVVYFYQGVLIPEGATLSRFEKEFLSQSLVLRTLELLHELAPEIGFKVAAEIWARQIENLREKYGAVLLKQLALPEKMQELERAVGKEIESARLELSVQRIIEAIRENRVEELPLPQKEIVLRAVMRAKIWNHDSSIWEVLEQVFGVVPGQVPPSRISEKEIKLTYMPQEKYERLEQKIAGKGEKKVFIKSRAMIRVRETGAEKWQVEVILNGGYNTLSGLFYRAFHELIYAMILNVQGRLPVEEKVNRELAGLINYYLVAGGIFERLDRGVEYTLSREMIKFIREVPEKGLTEGIVPSLIKAMPALVSTASEISTYEPIAGYEIRREVMDFEGTKVFVFDLSSLFKVKVKFGEITVEPISPAVFKMMENIVKVAEKERKIDKIKFAFVSNIRGLSKEVMGQMLIDYMLDYGLSPEVVGQIIDKDKRLILDRFTLRQTGRRISTKDVYDAVIRALAGRKAELVSGIKVTILTDNQKRWRERIREVLWVILTPKKGEMLSAATGLVVAIEGQVSPWLKAFIRDNWSDEEEAEKLLKILETERTFTVPATPVPRTYLDRMQTEKKIYRMQA
ncbi:hypothetical protein ES705_03909 [subsurface metagenome]